MAVGVARLFVGRTKVVVFAAVLLVAVYLLALTPVRTYISQRHQMAQEQTRLNILTNANNAMNHRVTQLQSSAEVEQLARNQYELVPPGQEAFAVMPPAKSVVTAPAPILKHKQSFWAHAWDDVTFWN